MVLALLLGELPGVFAVPSPIWTPTSTRCSSASMEPAVSFPASFRGALHGAHVPPSPQCTRDPRPLSAFLCQVRNDVLEPVV